MTALAVDVIQGLSHTNVLAATPFRGNRVWLANMVMLTLIICNWAVATHCTSRTLSSNREICTIWCTSDADILCVKGHSFISAYLFLADLIWSVLDVRVKVVQNCRPINTLRGLWFPTPYVVSGSQPGAGCGELMRFSICHCKHYFQNVIKP